jgi:cation/acetate symporter
MATTTTHRRLVNPMLGVYFGIFTSAMAALVLILLILERLGVGDGILRIAMLVLPILAYIAVGVAALCRDPAEFLAAGRRVPAVFTGLVVAGSAIGGTGLVVMTGLFFINGFDAWCIAIGVWAGLVMMALLVAPYLRKLGAYTLPSYLGRRLDSRLVRVTGAAVLLVPTVLVAVAELKTGALAAAWLSGWSPALVTQLMVLALVPMLAAGGVRSLTWVNAGQAIVALIALLVPVAIVAAFETNLPLPQLSHGPVLRTIGRSEVLHAVPIQIAPPLGLELAGQQLHTLSNRIAQPYTSVGPIAFILMILTVACGVAASPWLLPRMVCTPGVYDTRKSAAWAIVFTGLTLITAAAVAVFLRDMVMDQMVGRSAREAPQWFRYLAEVGLAGGQGNAERLALGNLAFKRDGILLALPIAAGFPAVVLYMTLAGVIAAALLGASAAIVAVSNILAEDGVGGLVWEPAAGLRVNVARLTLPAVAVVTGWIAMLVPADPLDLLLWGLALSASAAFPVIVLSVLWKRLNALGAIAGMLAGFVTALLAILAGEAAWLGVPGTLAAVFGMPAGFAAATIATRLGGLPERHVLTLVRDMRLPGGETIYDKQVRLQRMKQQRGP